MCYTFSGLNGKDDKKGGKTMEKYRFKVLLEMREELENFKQKYRFLLSESSLKSIEEAIEKINRQIHEIVERNCGVVV